MRNNESTGYLDCKGREIRFGDTVRIIRGKIDNLVSEGEQFTVYKGKDGAYIQVNVHLAEIAPYYCEVVDEKTE